MKKVLMCCLVILLAGSPVLNVNAAETNAVDNQIVAQDINSGELISPINVEESYIISADQQTIAVSNTITYQGEVIPASSIGYTKIVGDKTYKGTLYLQYYSYRTSTNQTVAYYEGTLYLQGSTS